MGVPSFKETPIWESGKGGRSPSPVPFAASPVPSVRGIGFGSLVPVLHHHLVTVGRDKASKPLLVKMEWNLWVVFFFGCCCCCCCCCWFCCCWQVFGMGMYSMKFGKIIHFFLEFIYLTPLELGLNTSPQDVCQVHGFKHFGLQSVMLRSNNSFHGKINKEKYTCSMRIPLTRPKYQNLSLHTTSTPLSYQTKVSPSGSSKVFLGFLFA